MPDPRELPEKSDAVLKLLRKNDGLRIEEIADREELQFSEAREIVHELWDSNLVVSGPRFEFDADSEDSIPAEQ